MSNYSYGNVDVDLILKSNIHAIVFLVAILHYVKIYINIKCKLLSF